MSHEAVNWARTQPVGNSPAKFVLMILADFAGTDWSCYPGVAKLAYLTELDERTVRRATARLIEQGLIRTFYRHRADGSRRSSRYQLLPDGPDTALPEVDDWSAMRAQDPVEHADTEPGSPGQGELEVRAESPDIPLTDPSVDPSPVKAPASRVERSTRVPSDFMPDENMRAWFLEEQLGAVIDGKREHAKFMDYWLGCPGAKGRKLDWPATWRNWMRSAAERADQRGYRRPGSALSPVSGAPQYASTTDERVAQGMALADKYEQMGM